MNPTKFSPNGTSKGHHNGYWEPGNSLGGVGKGAVHCRVFSSISVLYPLDHSGSLLPGENTALCNATGG